MQVYINEHQLLLVITIPLHLFCFTLLIVTYQSETMYFMPSFVYINTCVVTVHMHNKGNY